MGGRWRKKAMLGGKDDDNDDDDDDDDDNEPVWPTWDVGALSRGVKRLQNNNVCENVGGIGNWSPRP
jgi:hypothetical protein